MPGQGNVAGARPPTAGRDQARPARQAPTATTPQGVQGLALLSVEAVDAAAGVLTVRALPGRLSGLGVP